MFLLLGTTCAFTTYCSYIYLRNRHELYVQFKEIQKKDINDIPNKERNENTEDIKKICGDDCKCPVTLNPRMEVV